MSAPAVTVVPATEQNWRDIARVRPADGQRDWVADATYYLCLSAYGDLWRSCAIVADGETVGHVMWAVDPDEGSHWIGGLLSGQLCLRRKDRHSCTMGEAVEHMRESCKCWSRQLHLIRSPDQPQSHRSSVIEGITELAQGGLRQAGIGRLRNQHRDVAHLPLRLFAAFEAFAICATVLVRERKRTPGGCTPVRDRRQSRLTLTRREPGGWTAWMRDQPARAGPAVSRIQIPR